MDESDLVFHKNGDKYYSGGFRIDSLLLENDIPYLNTQKSESFMESLKGLAVPSGLLYIKREQKPYKPTKETIVISEGLYDKLLELSKPEPDSKTLSKPDSNSKTLSNTKKSKPKQKKTDTQKKKRKTRSKTQKKK